MEETEYFREGGNGREIAGYLPQKLGVGKRPAARWIK
jgi:hypothetical protein